MTAGIHTTQIDPAEFASMKQDISDVKAIMHKMADTLTRMALLEERQHGTASTTEKILDRLDKIELSLHRNEVAQASNNVSASRVEALEKGFRELHVERERDKARFQTVVWLVRAIYAVGGVGGLMALLKIGGAA